MKMSGRRKPRITEFEFGVKVLQKWGVNDLSDYVGTCYPPVQPGRSAHFEDLRAEPYWGRADRGIIISGIYVLNAPDVKKRPVRVPFDVCSSTD